MKQGVMLFALFFISHHTIAQQSATREIKPDARLYECFPKDYVDGLKDNPRLLLYYNFFLDNAFFVSDAKGKAPQGQDITKVTYKEPGPDGQPRYFNEDLSSFNPKKFNALQYQFNISHDKYTQYLLGNTGKVLIFYPQQYFTQKYREYLKTYNLDTEKK
jgi:hypothetical protein